MRKSVLMLMSLFIALTVYAQQKVKHVVLIGCDGFGTYALPEADMPNLKNLMKEGSWSLKARSVLPSSSAVNWASMIMGAGPTLHGYTEWNSAVPEIPSSDLTKEGMFPSIFSILKEQKPSLITALIYSWQGIDPLVQKGTTDIRIPAKDNDDFCTESAVEVIKKKKPTLTFIHLDQPDGVGHNTGHRTPAYYEELKKVDARIGKIVQAVKDAGIANETVIIVTADHGGKDKGHGGKTLDEVLIPWVVYGKGVKKNQELKNTIITYDIGATIAWLLGLKVPESWRGIPVKQAFLTK
ncbi:alkaline phosphatase [Elizabethkingia anophelis]|uniref:alkaline phosphatase n=1 Tax=Elizabethkingia anophelis TaxID=1117645 RepID=UPI00248F1322|nr:alkaline phosphatase [Elizabethkingia anophelis]EJC8058554.1 alkaline phosphatase [Elizabethkingia anophelis]MDV3780527.1 alkaline phosphatase [Elizabethkingia anophelis]MDV3790793.1 alkaline phosphatase [Elizabethkingia anophelis]MDV3811547.1 alkaline phosphatase [Elizabethkingia anophelis]MDV4006201.1 alkaline phosphatase [Elizabethkingia anophelis]